MLYTIQDTLLPPDGRLEGYSDSETAALQVVTRWILAKICHSNPNQGRTGPVCPFVPRSVGKKLLRLGVQRTRGIARVQLLDEIKAMGEVLRSSPPHRGASSVLKAIVLVFPDVPEDEAPTFLAELHAQLKPHFVANGSMIGEFWPTHDQPGRHSASFHSLESPIPLFVIRDMILDDIAHLSQQRGFIEAFVEKHGQRGCDEIFDYINRGELFPPSPEQVALLLDVVRERHPEHQRAPNRLDAITGFAPVHELAALSHGHGATVNIRVKNLDDVEAHGGRGAADFLLWTVAQLIRAELDDGDVVVSSGATSLVIFTEAERATALTNRLYDRLGSTTPRHKGTELDIIASIDWRRLDTSVAVPTPAF